ncbi:hypothetical protein BIY41_09810 [Xanthomonas citri pv. glycines]|uniref:Lysozyme n=1 Tax=Xanthomonas campestris pv. glycines TaxID=473421 RepID=A0AAX0I4U8_XANCG|nr:hypothetical protein BIY41_09810 [Xanthomonas citri pv. glycines]
MNRTAIALIAALIWSGAMFGAGWAWRGDRAEGANSEQKAGAALGALASEQAARSSEHKQAEVLAGIGAKHENDRQAAQAVPDAVVADLRSGALKLRDGWASCETQRLAEAAAGTRERDEATQRRDEFAGAVVRVGRDADDQLRACQAVVLADRGQVPQSTPSAPPGGARAWNKSWNTSGESKLNGETEHERSLIRSEMSGDPGASAVLPGGIRTPVRDSISAPRDAPPQVGQK